MFITRLDYLVNGTAEAGGESVDLGRSKRRETGAGQGAGGTAPTYAGLVGLSGELRRARAASDPMPTSSSST